MKALQWVAMLGFGLASMGVLANEAISQAFDRGDYRSVAVQGARALAADPKQDRLRMQVANSLAWTGRYDAAIVQYEKLVGTEFERDAQVGIGNIMRWRGRPEVAQTYFQQVLAKQPTHGEANKAMALLSRDLSPALTLKLVDAADNGKFARRDLSVQWRRWTDDRRFRTELGIVAGGDTFTGGSQVFRGVSGAVAAPKWWGAPKLDLAYHDNYKRGWFGGLELEPMRAFAPELLVLRAGKVDFGRQVFNQKAPALGLSASRLGASSRLETGVANIAARVDFYRISDDNRLIDGELKVTPHWQPLPFGVLADVGLYARKTDKISPDYWSQTNTYALATLGLRRAWYFDTSEFSLGLQQGIRLTDEARNTLSFSAGAKVWVMEDLALGLDLYLSKSPRPGDYRTRTLGITLSHTF
jgi:hypothetical protein